MGPLHGIVPIDQLAPWAVLQARLVAELLLAAALAASIGRQRHSKGRPAGMRTHILVAIAACSFTIAGVYGFGPNHGTGDAGRVAAQVVTGIGFLGAGVIWKTEGAVIGVTTAASLWVAAAIGMLVGAEIPVVAVVVTAIAYVTLAYLREPPTATSTLVPREGEEAWGDPDDELP